MKSVIFAVMCAAVGACGGSSGGSSGGADAGFSGSGDPHALVTCDKSWADGITLCEAACQYREIETGPSCASITGHTGGLCSKTFEVEGMYGCCDPMTNGSGETVREFYVCPP